MVQAKCTYCNHIIESINFLGLSRHLKQHLRNIHPNIDALIMEVGVNMASQMLVHIKDITVNELEEEDNN